MYNIIIDPLEIHDELDFFYEISSAIIHQSGELESDNYMIEEPNFIQYHPYQGYYNNKISLYHCKMQSRRFSQKNMHTCQSCIWFLLRTPVQFPLISWISCIHYAYTTHCTMEFDNDISISIAFAHAIKYTFYLII